MRKQPSICSILGLTQEDAAKLVGVHRSQWSMFESGKRSLPAAANVILATLLSAAQAEPTTENGTAHNRHQSESHQLLNKLLLENTYQLETISRKLANERAIAEANIRRQRVADCLNTQSHPMGKTIKDKAEKALQFNGRLLELELKLEVLKLKKKLIESRLKGK